MRKLEEFKPFPYIAWFLVIAFSMFVIAFTIRAQEIAEDLVMVTSI